MKFAGEVAIVTGGYSGIGAQVVEQLAAQGAYCVILGRNRERAQKFIESQEKLQEQLCFFQCDIGDLEQVSVTVSKITDRFEKINHLVNCAGTNLRKSALEYSIAEWQYIMNTNLNGVFFISQAVAQIMKKQLKGCVVNIGSMTSHYGVPHVAAYAATKGAISQLTRSLAVEWANVGIRVNQVSPGYIETPLNAVTFANKTYRNKLVQRTPLKRLGTPKDVANAILFLLSEESAFITGQIIAVDGGILAGDPNLDPLKH